MKGMRKLRRLLGSLGAVLELQEIAEAADCSEPVLAPGYRSRRSPELLANIARGVASLIAEHGYGHPLLADQLTAWLAYNQKEPTIERLLGELKKLRRCRGPCGKWLPSKDINPSLCRCQPCIRDIGFQRHLERRPDLVAYYRELARQLPAAKKKDPELAHAVASIYGAMRAARGEPPERAVKKVEVAEQLGQSPAQINRRWRKAGLPGLLFLSSLGAAQVSSAATTPPPMKRRKGPDRPDHLTDRQAGSSQGVKVQPGRTGGRTSQPIAIGGRRRRVGPGRPAEAIGAEHRAGWPSTRAGALREREEGWSMSRRPKQTRIRRTRTGFTLLAAGVCHAG